MIPNVVASAFRIVMPWIPGFLAQAIFTAAPAPFPQGCPLPPNSYPQDLKPEVHAAYDQCLQSQVEAGDNATLLMYARCLAFLIIEAPDDDARDYISHEIMQCEGNGDRMNELAQLYINHLFRLFRQDKGCTPIPSFHPSRPSFEEELFFFSSTVDPAPADHRASKRAALKRDNFCCIVTGRVDTDYYRSLSNKDTIARYPNPPILERTNFCHIFPPSTSQDLEPEQPNHSESKTHYAGSIWGIVLNYGHINVLDELNGSDCHRLSNGLTLTTGVHEEFDRLCLWFEAIPNSQHTYRVCTLFPHCGPVESLPHPRIVTFTTTTNHPLPDPRYLKLHAVVCRVGHLSGVAEHLDMYDHEQDERSFLANDGSSAEYLTSRLHSVLVT